MLHRDDPFHMKPGGPYGTHFTRCHWFPMVDDCRNGVGWASRCCYRRRNGGKQSGTLLWQTGITTAFTTQQRSL